MLLQPAEDILQDFLAGHRTVQTDFLCHAHDIRPTVFSSAVMLAIRNPEFEKMDDTIVACAELLSGYL